MWATFCKFDQKPTRLWIMVQVLLVSLIVIGITLLCTERYWLPPVVSFLLERERVAEQEASAIPPGQPQLPHEIASTSLVKPRTSPMSTSTTPFAISLPTTSKRGESVMISWQLAQVPAGASIGFFINGGTLMFPRPLTLKTVPLTEATGNFTWDGERYGCDPLDTPTYCKDIATGAYTISAKVYDKSEVSLVDGDRQVPLVHDEKVLYISAEMPLAITGVPSAERIDTFKQVVANRINTEYLKEANLLALWDSTATAQEDRIKPYITSESAFTGPDAAGKFCMNFSLTLPFAGTFKVCGPDTTFYRDTADQFTVSGDFTMAPGALSFQTAKKNVLDTVWSRYQSRVAFRYRPTDAEAGYTGDKEGFQNWINTHGNADTYLSSTIDDWSYRTDDGGYWAFVVHATKIGSATVVPDNFNDKLIMRVDNNANVCVAQTYDYLTYTGNVLDIHKDKITCQ